MVANSYDPLQGEAMTLRPASDGRPPGAETAALAAPAAMLASRTVVVYLLISLLVLLPGLAVWAVPASAWHGTVAAPLLDPLASALDDIHFAAGFRFWAGVAGAAAMASLLLYPLRKAFGAARWTGRVSSWFHIHILLGLLGPVLIAYHCFFGLGAPDANVALATMLTVVFSGIVGQFAHRTASARFHTMRREARAHFDAVLGTLGLMHEQGRVPRALAEQFTDFDDSILKPSRGLIATMIALAGIERQRRTLARSFSGYVIAHGASNHLDNDAVWHNRAKLGAAFTTYIWIARRAAARSLFDQLWSRWRLFHLPAFLVMVVATGLHVYAVWPKPHADVVSAASDARDAARPPSPPRAAPPRVKPAGTKLSTRKPTLKLEAQPKLVHEGVIPAPHDRQAQAVPTKNQPAAPAAPADDELAAFKTSADAYRPFAASTEAPPRSVRAEPAASPPVNSVAAAAPPPAAAKTVIGDVLAEVQRRFATPTSDGNRSALGAGSVRSLDEQIADLKAKMKTGTFHHAQSETGFALVGKHSRVDCKKCHTEPLRDAPSSSPRPCKSCHMPDDVHHGRRPQCANCHEPTSWKDTH